MNSNGSQLTKQQVKFFIETMTDDMHGTIQHKIAETLLEKFDECESLANMLRAFEHLQNEPKQSGYFDGQLKSSAPHTLTRDDELPDALDFMYDELPDDLDFDCEFEKGDYDIDEEPWLRGRVDGFNEALRVIKRSHNAEKKSTFQPITECEPTRK